MFIPCSATCFLEVGAYLLLRLVTKTSFRSKKLWKFRFSGYFTKATIEECHQKNWSFSNKFGMFMPVSEKYFLEVSPHVSLKVIKDSVRDKKNKKI